MNTRTGILTVGALLGTALAASLACGSECLCSSASAQEPSACTLPTEDREARERQYRAMLRGQDARLEGMTVRVALRGEPAALERRMNAIAEAERECCSFLTLRFEPTESGGIVELSAAGEAAWTIAPILDALR